MRWRVDQENITILGMQGSGKTTIARHLLDSIPAQPRLIISPQTPVRHYGPYGNLVNDIRDVQNGGAYLWMGNTDVDTLERIFAHVMRFKNFLIVIDDVHEFCSKQKIGPNFATYINSGRNRGLSSIWISPNPTLVSNILLSSSTHLFSFRFVLESHIEYSRKNFFGSSGYLLLNQRTRPYAYQRYPQLDKHDYLYRSVNEDYIELHRGDQVTPLYDISDLQEPQGEPDQPDPEADQGDETPGNEPDPKPESDPAPEQPPDAEREQQEGKKDD